MKRAIVKSMADILHGAVIANYSSLLSSFYLQLMLFVRWRHYFPRLIH